MAESSASNNNPYGLSSQDFADLTAIRAQMKADDPRVGKIDILLRSSAPSVMTPQMRLNLVRNASPTQFEIERNKSFQPGFGGSVADFARGAIQSIPQMFQMAQNPQEARALGQQPQQNPAYQAGQQAAIEDQRRKAAGASLPYRAAAVAAGPLVNVPAVEHAADVGDAGAIAGNTAPQAALAVAPLAAEGLSKGFTATGRAVGTGIDKLRIGSVEELTGTTPRRIAELNQFPQKVEAIRQSVVAAEDAAHKAASAAFPKFDKPIPTGRMVEAQPEGPTMLDDFGEVRPSGLKPEMTTWDALQEQRSNLLADIAVERRAVSRGATPRFDLADMYSRLQRVDDLMNKAAAEQGGANGLAQLQKARAQYARYMEDFHNQGSPLRGIIDAKPGETARVANQLLSADKGARAIETLKRYGADASPIESLVTQGDRPVRVAVNESAKLRKAGSPEAYQLQRLRESLAQATTNELPSSPQGRLPSSAMSRKPMVGTSKIPLVRDFMTPRARTIRALRNALAERGVTP